MNHVLEVVIFKLNAGVDRDAFLQGAQATFDMLAGYDGYLSRELTESAEGVWADVVRWRDMESAFAAAEAVMSDPIMQTFGAMIDESTMQMLHLSPQIVAEMAG